MRESVFRLLLVLAIAFFVIVLLLLLELQGVSVKRHSEERRLTQPPYNFK